VGLEGNKILAEVSIPLVSPGDSVAQECSTQVEEDFLFRRRGGT